LAASRGPRDGPRAFRRLHVGLVSIVKTRILNNLLEYTRRLEIENVVLVQQNHEQQQQLQERDRLRPAQDRTG
jgi:hypothetical protein